MFLCISSKEVEGGWFRHKYKFCSGYRMTTLWNKTLQEIRDTTASPRPFATSVAISLIAAVNGCALLEMSMVLAVAKAGRKKQNNNSSRTNVSGITARIIAIRAHSDRLAALADEDIRLFHSVISSAEKSRDPGRQSAISQVAIFRSVRVPLQAIEEIIGVYPLISLCAKVCPDELLSDLPAASNLLEAAVNNLVIVVKSNTRHLPKQIRANMLTSLNCLIKSAPKPKIAIDKFTPSPI